MKTPEMFAIGSLRWPGISKVAEETGELQQVIGKLQATGGETAHWDGSDLRIRLEEEIADVLAACSFVVSHNTELDLAAISNRRAAKMALFCKWHYEARDRDTSGS